MVENADSPRPDRAAEPTFRRRDVLAAAAIVGAAGVALGTESASAQSLTEGRREIDQEIIDAQNKIVETQRAMAAVLRETIAAHERTIAEQAKRIEALQAELSRWKGQEPVPFSNDKRRQDA